MASLLIVIILMAIGSYFIRGYQWLLMDIILVAIGGYFTNGYYIISYCWLLYVTIVNCNNELC